MRSGSASVKRQKLGLQALDGRMITGSFRRLHLPPKLLALLALTPDLEARKTIGEGAFDRLLPSYSPRSVASNCESTRCASGSIVASGVAPRRASGPMIAY